jgi:hypothetical protein
VTPADQLVAQCVLPVVHEEVAAAVQAEGNEPELIRKPKEVEEGEAEE